MGALAETVDPDGRAVVLDQEGWDHILHEHRELATHRDEIMATVSSPNHRRPDPRSGRERYYSRDVARGGVLLALAAIVLAGPIISLLAGGGAVRLLAARYLRIAALGIPSALLTLAGQGYLRGVSDLRRPFVVLVVASTLNALLELLFIYGFGWGLAGSAWATVIAQTGMGAAFLVLLMRAPARRRMPSLVAMRPVMPIFALMQRPREGSSL